MIKVTFKYKDNYSKGQWNTQSCVVSNIDECKKIYGLDEDPNCEYEILEVEEV